MRFPELAVLYLIIGMGCALVLFFRHPTGTSRVSDSLIMAGLWPIYGPFVLLGHPPSVDPSSDVDFIVALRRASGTPLAALLPDQATVTALARRLRVAAGKISEIDHLLERSEFNEQDAVARQAELKQRGASDCAISTAAMRLSNIRKLRRMRDRFARELDEVHELLAQLKTQADVVRLAGSPADETRDLVVEIISRVEGLDRMIDDDPFASLDSDGTTRHRTC